MSRVLMLVINPMTNDTRVEKEAASLAAAGHQVTVVGTWAEGLPAVEDRDGYRIQRVQYRRVVKDRVLAPAARLEAARRARERATDGLDRAGLQGTPERLSVLSDATWFLRRVLTRAVVLAGGALLKLLRTRILVPEYWGSIGRRLPVLVERPDVIHAHDLGPLAAAVRLSRSWGDGRRRPRVVYDSHELYVEQQTSWTRREKVAWWLHERRWIRHADAVITVSPGIASELARRYGLAEEPTLVLNSPPSTAEPAEADVRADLGLGDGETLAVYVGTVKPGRGVDRIVAALPFGDWHLAVVGAGGGDHVAEVRQQAERAGVGARFHVLPGVPAATLPSYLATADVGVHAMEATCRNHELALPNKLFDYVFAGLPVAVSDLEEMGGLVREHGLGTLFDPTDPRSLATAVADAAALAEEAQAEPELLLDLSWEHQAERLVGLYRRL